MKEHSRRKIEITMHIEERIENSTREETLTHTRVEDIEEKEDDLIKGNLEEPILSVDVKDIELLNVIKEVPIRRWKIVEEKHMLKKNMLDHQTQLVNWRKENHL